ncbi:MAG TPA: hypothetical protein PK176_01660 [Acidobacteriota bacterium]|nr:hypothetical protein [Acidobacteriota bacterium]HQM61996.1 hypothetical protein [Acidobacteriota bacterium]
MRLTRIVLGFLALLAMAPAAGHIFAATAAEAPVVTAISTECQHRTVDALAERWGADVRERAERGVRQLACLWTPTDGPEAEFERFCREQFIGEPQLRRQTFARIQDNMELIHGRFHQIHRSLSEPLELDLGQPLAVDYLFQQYAPAAHLADDLFGVRIAQLSVLNFPFYTLAEKNRLGAAWSREEWAMARLGDWFNARVPAEVAQQSSRAYAESGNYVATYNIHIGNLLQDGDRRPWAQDRKLVTHWNLRDEIRAQYAEPDGLSRQELLAKVLERIVDGSIPQQVIDDPRYAWDPAANRLFETVDDNLKELEIVREGARRYQQWLNLYHASRRLDAHMPLSPTAIDRKFNLDRQIPETEVEQLLQAVLRDPVAQDVGRLVARRLGRELKPFDIWYGGFRSGPAKPEAELDRIVRARYPTVAAFQADLPTILQRLGFAPDRAAFVADHVAVDASRGIGHAMGASMRGDKAHLRTRVAPGGMDYKGFNIAMHEFGHNVEQVLSLEGVDYYAMSGVPNNAFTECFAYVFQARDLQVLGLGEPDALSRQMQALDTFWITYEIAGVSLVEMRAWRWLYAHPEADAAAFQAEVLRLAREVWNEYYAPVFQVRDCPILAVYQHMVYHPLYLADYALGHLIHFQVESALVGKPLGVEMERMCRQGALTPRYWMRGAVGNDLTAEPLLSAAREAARTAH